MGCWWVLMGGGGGLLVDVDGLLVGVDGLVLMGWCGWLPIRVVDRCGWVWVVAGVWSYWAKQ